MSEQEDIKKTEQPESSEEAPKTNMKDMAFKMVDKTSIVGIIVQMIIGILLTWLTFLIGKWVMMSDDISKEQDIDGKLMQFDVMSGYADSSQLSVVTYNTILPFAPNYIAIPFSSNIKGGSQFTYSFWANINDYNNTALLERPILLRGDKKKYPYTIKNLLNNDVLKVNDYVTMCPMICFGSEPMDFAIYFNTTNNIKETMYVKRIESNDSVFRKNIMTVLQKSWILLTFTFEDNIPINDFENGIRVQMFVNDLLYDTQVFNGMLKQNTGNLYFFPEATLPGVRLADIRYFNYAVDIEKVKSLYKIQPSTKAASLTKVTYNAVDISDGNIFNYYNT